MKYSAKAKNLSFFAIVLKMFDEIFVLVFAFEEYLRYNLLTIVVGGQENFSLGF